jgi:D-sedoheptulose 7-phosphate isomerase
MNYLSDYSSQLQDTIACLNLSGIQKAISWLEDARDTGRTIFVCGNGGSASTASHFACDIVKGASYQRDTRFRIMALTDSLPTLTAYSNDVGYEHVFVEQLRNFAKPGDVVLAISGSGNSPNVVSAVDYANSTGCKTISLTGRDGGKLGALSQLDIRVPVPHMGRIEDAHMIVCHMMAYYFMEKVAA